MTVSLTLLLALAVSVLYHHSVFIFGHVSACLFLLCTLYFSFLFECLSLVFPTFFPSSTADMSNVPYVLESCPLLLGSCIQLFSVPSSQSRAWQLSLSSRGRHRVSKLTHLISTMSSLITPILKMRK